jgi:serine/threonine-protein kinase
VTPSQLPRRFGPYVIVRHLNEGGMGTVHLAVSGKPGYEKACVLKQMLVEAANAIPEQEARFRREAQIVRRLSHGAIAQTLAVGEVAGTPYIAQEFIHGRDLSQVVTACSTAGERFPKTIAVHVVREVARALAYAHEFDGLGLVHRDVTPHNVMLGFAGEIKLVDFGIAKSRFDPALTEPGAMLGRRNYMAPEVLAGGEPDHRADLFSLGVVLWELLAGRLLALAGGTAADPPPPSSFNPEIPPDLDAIALRAIAWQAADRFQSAQDLHSALGPFVPRAFMGDAAVREFLARHYDVERQRNNLRSDLATATPLLDPAPADVPPATETQDVPRTRRWPFFLLAAALVGAAGAGVAVQRGRGGETSPRPRPSPVVPSRGASNPSEVVPAVPPPAPPSTPEPAAEPEAPAERTTVAAPAPSAPSRRNAPTLRPRRTTTRSASAAPRSAAELLDEAERAYSQGDVGEAIRKAQLAVERGGGPRAHSWLGNLLSEVGRYAEAERHLEIATRANPSDLTAASVLRVVRKKLGRDHAE